MDSSILLPLREEPPILMPDHLIFAAAFTPELAPFSELFKNEPRVELAPVGIGLVQSAIGTTELLLKARADRGTLDNSILCFVGSVGAIDNTISPLTMVTARSVSLADGLVQNNQAWLPEVIRTKCTVSEQVFGELDANLPSSVIRGSVFTTLAPITDSDLAKELSSSTGAGFVSLELFAVVAACERLGMRWCTINCVTDTVGPMSESTWKGSFREAARKTAALCSSVSAILLD